MRKKHALCCFGALAAGGALLLATAMCGAPCSGTHGSTPPPYATSASDSGPPDSASLPVSDADSHDAGVDVGLGKEVDAACDTSPRAATKDGGATPCAHERTPPLCFANVEELRRFLELARVCTTH